MAQIITGTTQSKVINQLDTYNHTAGASTMYRVEVRLNEIPSSGITIAIKQNASTIITTAVPAAGQNHIEVRTVLNCIQNDVIGVVIASSTPGDQGGNSFKAILTINQGAT